jgi:hypothetical protein
MNVYLPTSNMPTNIIIGAYEVVKHKYHQLKNTTNQEEYTIVLHENKVYDKWLNEANEAIKKYNL